MKQKGKETPQQTIERIETFLDQLYDLEDRNKLNIQTINDFQNKLRTLETQVNDHLKRLNDDAKKYKTTIQEAVSFIKKINDKMMEEEIEIYNREIRKIKEKYEMKNKAYERTSSKIQPIQLTQKEYNLSLDEINQIEE